MRCFGIRLVRSVRLTQSIAMSQTFGVNFRRSKSARDTERGRRTVCEYAHIYVLSDAVPFCIGRKFSGGSVRTPFFRRFARAGRTRSQLRRTAQLTWPHASNARVHHLEQTARLVLQFWHMATEIAPPARSRARVCQRPNVAVAEQVC